MTGLPDGWATITIGEASGVGGLSTDGDWIESKDQDPTGSVRLIQLQDIGDGTFVNKSSRFLTEEKAEELNCTFLSPGDVLIARMPDPLGRACRFPDIGQKSVTAVDVHVWRKGEHGVEPDYLVYCVNSPEIRQSLQAQASGTTRQRVSGGRLKAQEIPLPPLPEQRRIVRKLDTLSVRSTTARTHLTAIEKLVERYKASLLSKLIWQNDRQMQRIDELGKIVTGSTPPSKEEELCFGGPYPFFKPADLNAEYFVTSAQSTVTEYGLAKSRFIPAGATMVTCIGTIGKTGFARVAGCTNQQINSVVPNKSTCPEWVYFAVCAPEFQEAINQIATATTIRLVNKSRFSELQVPVFELEEQREIVRRIETAFAKIDRLAAEAAKALKLLGHLDQRILAKAFAGELVPQDPNDEPAETLLARLRAQRRATPKGRRRGLA